ncbi:uncharacterized protein LOC129905959 [Episyrphus balteatus]|uniref:uncharacterized protein LOC129905959 n=1 Tax=Episyrphus balteatus TaxID=286459 RepID=UPI00248596E8|nr:uncharacterized protein LOC129905959 [Episyrphus balteatus]
MKCSIILAIFACVLSATFASSHHKVEKAHSEVMSYAQMGMRNVRMMRGNTMHLECFNGFLPLINSLATKAKDVSNACVYKSNYEKDQELLNLQNSRAQVAAEVEKISKSLSDCTKLGGLQYFICLQDNAETNRKLMQLISDQSRDLMSKYADKSDEIDNSELSCIMKAVATAKAETDQAYVDLKECIKNGPIIQTQIGDDESSTNETLSTGTTDSPSSSSTAGY